MTDSWNIAYRKFKQENYDALIISNNDVIFNISLSNFIQALGTYPIVVPMTNHRGEGSQKKSQIVEKHYPFFKRRIADDPIKHKTFIHKLNIMECKSIPWVHGFCFGMNRDAIICEHDDEHMFDPKNINCHQEPAFLKNIVHHNFKSMLCLSCFVYHYGSKSLPYKGQINGIDSRNVLSYNRKD